MILSLLVVIPPALRTSVAIALGAIPGALCRYYFTFWLSRWFGNDLPYATFLVNFTGAIGMGIVVTLVTAGSSWLTPDLRILVAVGFLGSYTTFSTYVLEVTSLWQSGLAGQSLLYGIGSLILGVIGILMGSLVAQRWLT